MPRAFLIANVLGFQAVWFASVIGAAKGLPWAGPVAVAIYAAAHFARTPDRRGDLRMLAIALGLGVVVDSLLAATGVLAFASPWPSAHTAPVWILAMWAGFALTLNHSMAFLRGRWLAAFLFGAVGGPLAYWGASRGFDAVTFSQGLPVAVAALAVTWGIAMPALYALHGAGRDAVVRRATA
jgi:FtsH-binding integral membrane protein